MPPALLLLLSSLSVGSIAGLIIFVGIWLDEWTVKRHKLKIHDAMAKWWFRLNTLSFRQLHSALADKALNVSRWLLGTSSGILLFASVSVILTLAFMSEIPMNKWDIDGGITGCLRKLCFDLGMLAVIALCLRFVRSHRPMASLLAVTITALILWAAGVACIGYGNGGPMIYRPNGKVADWSETPSLRSFAVANHVDPRWAKWTLRFGDDEQEWADWFQMEHTARLSIFGASLPIDTIAHFQLHDGSKVYTLDRRMTIISSVSLREFLFAFAFSIPFGVVLVALFVLAVAKLMVGSAQQFGSLALERIAEDNPHRTSEKFKPFTMSAKLISVLFVSAWIIYQFWSWTLSGW